MGIDFSEKRWEKVKSTYSAWWKGELDRPIIPVIIHDAKDPGRVKPKAPLLSQKTCCDLTIPVDELIDRIDYELESKVYLGDSFPVVNLDVFGPGIVAAFLGAEMDNKTGNVWFVPKEVVPIKDLHFEYIQNNKWFKRIKEFCCNAVIKWNGQVMISMPDLGGVLDILSVFRTAENLLFDLLDEPDEVKRLIYEIHILWMRYFKEINEILIQGNQGYLDWSGIYSDKPIYIIQSDFCYMLSPDHFLEFVLPQITKWTMEIDRTIYHMDGEGQLNHFDFLLDIKQLDGIQWVSGKKKVSTSQLGYIYTKINEAGKKMQVWSGFDTLEYLKKELHITKGVAHIEMSFCKDMEKTVKEKLCDFDIEP